MAVLPQSSPAQERTPPQQTRRVRVLWPWLLIAVAWGVLLLATLAHQTFLLDHHYLLQASGLPWLIGAVTFLLAGLFQFSAFKGRCLDMCRAPLGFFLHYYRKGVSPAWQLGLRHGGYCLGCCWALMLVMFGVGVGNLAGMAALTGVMVIEKTVPGGKRLSPYIGVLLLLLGVLWLMHPVWLQSVGI